MVETGPCFEVLLTHGVAREYQDLEPRSRAALARHMQKLAREGMADLLALEVLKVEQRIDGIMVYALRDRITRLYGGPVPRIPTPMFLMTEISTKKRGAGKADQELLRRAAKHLGEYMTGTKGGRR